MIMRKGADYLIEAYEEIKQRYSDKAYKHMDEIFKLAKNRHKKDFDKRIEQAKKANKKVITDHEQSWKGVKGKGLETLVASMLEDKVQQLGMEMIDGNRLERTKASNLCQKLAGVKFNLLVDYGKDNGCHLPDADRIIYCPKTYKVKAIVSIKSSLRERVAQAGYWKLKISGQPNTKHIKFYFVTSDSDDILNTGSRSNKSRSIAEIDTDGSYVLGDVNPKSSKVKEFSDFFDDLEKLKD